MNYPLFLSYQGVTIGNGFVAEITARAQMLATIDKEGAWIYGVRPGAIAESGDNLDQAHMAIRETLRLVFVDFATEATSYEGFKAEVERFFAETDDTAVSEWTAAVEAIRKSGDGTLGLPKLSAESGMVVTVTEKTMHLTADMNVPPLAAEQPVQTPKLGPAVNVGLAAAA